MSLLSFPDPSAMALSIRASALVFEDPNSKKLLTRIRLLAPSDVNVLIIGETGTGKELVARHIHALSARRHGPFLAVNCGALSETLIESELFGHEKGAFTGAITTKRGWFEAASGGTLFLDEIGDLPQAMQVKLLRVLQEREVVRVGSHTPIPIDVRLIAATNVKLEEAVLAGRFREDLYYRLNVAALNLLPLRQRPGDIMPLARHFLRFYGQRLGCPETALSPDAEQALLQHSWPGNIRELENVIHHALLIARNRTITPTELNLSTLPLRERQTPAGTAPEDLDRVLESLCEKGGPDLYARIEHALFRAAYRHCNGNQLATARLLGLSRHVVRARLIQYGIVQRNEKELLSNSVKPSPAPSKSRRSLSNSGATPSLADWLTPETAKSEATQDWWGY
ncbi:sigma-54 interaction domain-containing protein [Methylocaldum szegediense]|jgi:sigma-54-specific transcriptional regulator|uniref:Sigma54-dependent transcriptional activator SfnR n=1 Tax=Methylocaldum szegediense TaxID=73780 RepID=A0ABN8XCT8_9GAMM|nr:sigma-54 dependent transcriptional regulator [Methylocaldum szegediense]CAI8975139.1 Sigma54-dependent transcriptional activator SfnR [Methylocaldum szegediense]